MNFANETYAQVLPVVKPRAGGEAQPLNTKLDTLQYIAMFPVSDKKHSLKKMRA